MKIADHIKTAVPAAIVLFLALQKGSGFLVILFLPFFLLTMIYHIVQMVRRPDERKSRGNRIAVWSLVIVVALAVQSYWRAASRNDAQLALNKVMEYKERAGVYPSSLREVGLDDRYLKEKWKIRYWVREGKPALVYPVTFMPFDMHEYDFESRTWRENPY